MSAVSPAVQSGAEQIATAMGKHGWETVIEHGRGPVSHNKASILVIDRSGGPSGGRAKGRLLARVTVEPTHRGAMGRTFTVWPVGLSGLYPLKMLSFAHAGARARDVAHAVLAEYAALHAPVSA